mmetsp:Transcript_111490/g.296309  ORF Transcript_111490/g.296309 Transcript_111490/m.296309 type:complete len:232 (-) Transcript_111490:38-733(-)
MAVADAPPTDMREFLAFSSRDGPHLASSASPAELPMPLDELDMPPPELPMCIAIEVRPMAMERACIAIIGFTAIIGDIAISGPSCFLALAMFRVTYAEAFRTVLASCIRRLHSAWQDSCSWPFCRQSTALSSIVPSWRSCCSALSSSCGPGPRAPAFLTAVAMNADGLRTVSPRSRILCRNASALTPSTCWSEVVAFSSSPAPSSSRMPLRIVGMLLVVAETCGALRAASA